MCILRLTEQSDHENLFEIILKASRAHLKISTASIFADLIGDHVKNMGNISEKDVRNLFYGCYMEPDAEPRVYDEADNYKNLEKLMHYYLREYNLTTNGSMDLILFHFAIEHISR